MFSPMLLPKNLRPKKPRLGHRVDIVRESKGVTRPELAARLKVDRTTVIKWGTEGSAPRDIERVAKVLGVTVAEIFATTWPAAA